jgi:predicted nucleotidyltransferase
MELFTLLRQTLNNMDNIIFAYIFGSYADRTANNLSDIDIAVYLDKIKPDFDDYLTIHSHISRLIKTNSLDLLILNNVKNLILLDSIVRQGIVICDKDREKRFHFELSVIHSAIDFKEHRRAIIGI